MFSSNCAAVELGICASCGCDSINTSEQSANRLGSIFELLLVWLGDINVLSVCDVCSHVVTSVGVVSAVVRIDSSIITDDCEEDNIG